MKFLNWGIVESFAVLGLSPTNNETEIKSAYATKLRLCNPEDNQSQWVKIHDAFRMILDWLRDSDEIPTIADDGVVPDDISDFFSGHEEIAVNPPDSVISDEPSSDFEDLFAEIENGKVTDELFEDFKEQMKFAFTNKAIAEKSYSCVLDHQWFLQHPYNKETVVLMVPLLDKLKRAPGHFNEVSKMRITEYIYKLETMGDFLLECRYTAFGLAVESLLLALETRHLERGEGEPVWYSPCFKTYGSTERTAAIMMPLLKMYIENPQAFSDLDGYYMASYEEKVYNSKRLPEVYRNKLIEIRYYPSLKEIKRMIGLFINKLHYKLPDPYEKIEVLNSKFYKEVRDSQLAMELIEPIVQLFVIDEPILQERFPSDYKSYIRELSHFMKEVFYKVDDENLLKRYKEYIAGAGINYLECIPQAKSTKKKPVAKKTTKKVKETYHFVWVSFPDDDDIYLYRCDDLTIKYGMKILVDTINGPIEVTVALDVDLAEDQLEEPLETYKWVLRKVE